MAPPSVGVATPMKIVPSTRKIRNSGGTITKVTCWASADRKRKPVILPRIQFSTAADEGEHDGDGHDQDDEIGAAIGLGADREIADQRRQRQ